MKIRRIAAGHGPDGKSRVASDTLVAPATVTLSPGTEFFTLWGGDNLPSFPDDGSPHGFSTYFPPPAASGSASPRSRPQGARLEIPDMAAARSEMEEKLPGMHSSDTIDFIYVISGEIWMTLDDGTEVHLRPGETLVRKRHAPRVEKQGNGAVQFRHLFHRRTPWSLRAP